MWRFILNLFRFHEAAPKTACLVGQSPEFIRALAELEQEFPTGDAESLAAVAWVADRPKVRLDPKTGDYIEERPARGTVRGSYQTLLAPGLRYSDLQAAGLGGYPLQDLGGNPYQAAFGGLGQGFGLGGTSQAQHVRLQLQERELQQQRMADGRHQHQLAMQALVNAALGGQKH